MVPMVAIPTLKKPARLLQSSSQISHYLNLVSRGRASPPTFPLSFPSPRCKVLPTSRPPLLLINLHHFSTIVLLASPPHTLAYASSTCFSVSVFPHRLLFSSFFSSLSFDEVSAAAAAAASRRAAGCCSVALRAACALTRGTRVRDRLLFGAFGSSEVRKITFSVGQDFYELKKSLKK